MLYFIPKHREYLLCVECDESNYLTITHPDGSMFKDAGRLILSCGGVDNFLTRCIESPLSGVELARQLDKSRAAAQKAKRLREMAKEEQEQREQREAEATLRKLVEDGEPIEVTLQNVRTLLKYLRLTNWGVWHLPQMTIGYKAHQYDCDGVTAVTVVFDSPVELIDGEVCAAYAFGAPRGHLTKYCHLR